MMTRKDGKWVLSQDLTTEQWKRFLEAAEAQASLDDALAAACWPDWVPDDISTIDAQCHAMYGRPLTRLYNQARAKGRAEFMIAAAAAAKNSASMATWFGDKTAHIGEGAEGVTVIVDV